MGWTAFLLVYLFGGITFLPLLVASVFLHAYLTFPVRYDLDGEGEDIVQDGDDVAALGALKEAKGETKETREEKGEKRASHYDVAAGYFAVCREYTPMGINAKPIERATPVGSATVAAPSPSVYQAMYRSIFDRKQAAPGPLDCSDMGSGSSASQRPKRAGNVFYVVLRHGHLMLFDDDEQLEVRHVISLAHHDVSICSGGDNTPEGELFIRRNAICLSRNRSGAELGPDSQLSKPFYLFSENCSAKEDFYFALLQNQQQQTAATGRRVPSPLGFEVPHIISLVQKLHYSDEHAQTRWLNAMIGRLFLGVYRTRDVESFIREKLTKKISRVKRPSFLSNIEIRSVDTGESAPYFTNPRLKDLTVAGECAVEADVRYTGNFRLEVAATARIELGARFKARQVDLVLSVAVRRVEGRAYFKIKPPPSNRLWVAFQQMPKVELTVEPVVSSRQITYTLILRQIENRIKEVIAETMVLPFWDDTPFFRTEHKAWRGGIFEGDDAVDTSSSVDSQAAMREADSDQQPDEAAAAGAAAAEPKHPFIEKSYSLPVIEATSTPASQTTPRKKPPGEVSGGTSPAPATPSSSTVSIDVAAPSGSQHASPIPRLGRSSSLASPSTPVVGTDATNADIFKPSSPPDQSPAATAIADLSKSQATAPNTTPQTTTATTPAPPGAAAPFKPYITSKSSSQSVKTPRGAADTSGNGQDEEGNNDDDATPRAARRNTASSAGSHDDKVSLSSASTKASLRSQTGSLTRGLFSRRDTSNSSGPSSPGGGNGNGGGGGEQQKRTALAAVTNAAATARRWGLSAIQRRGEENNNINNNNNNRPRPGKEPPLDLKQPIGRGRPLPPPGMPLPMPDKKTKTAPIPVPRRQPAPPPLSASSQPPPLPGRQHSDDRVITDRTAEQIANQTANQTISRRPVPPPPLPKRRQPAEARDGSGVEAQDDGILVVAAPSDSSEPTTPLSATSPSYVGPWVEDADDEGGAGEAEAEAETPLAASGSDPMQSASEGAVEAESAEAELAEGDEGAEEDDFSAWMDDEAANDEAADRESIDGDGGSSGGPSH